MSGKKKYTNDFRVDMVEEYFRGKSGDPGLVSMKYGVEKEEITTIYHENQGRYGYRRVTLSLNLLIFYLSIFYR